MQIGPKANNTLRQKLKSLKFHSFVIQSNFVIKIQITFFIM